MKPLNKPSSTTLSSLTDVTPARRVRSETVTTAVIASRSTDYVPQGQAWRSVTVDEEPHAVIREEGA